jgi:hypothetical protein
MTLMCAVAVLATFCGPVFPPLPPASSPHRVAANLPGTPGRVAVGAGGVWATAPYGEQGHVMRIDPVRNRIAASITLRRLPFEIAAGAGAVWVTGNQVRGEDVLYRIDASTNRLLATIALPGRFAGPLALGAGGVWVVVSDRRRTLLTLVRVDPATNEVVRTVPVARRWVADDLVLRDGSAWLLTRAGEVLRLDLRANRLADRIDAHARSIGAGPGGLWMTRPGLAQEIDENGPGCPGIAVPGLELTPLLVGRRRVWLGGHDADDRSVAIRLDPRTSRIDRVLRMGSAIYTGMTLDPDRHAIWIARVTGDLLRVDLARR